MLRKYYDGLRAGMTDEEVVERYVDYYHHNRLAFERELKESQSQNTHLAVVSDSASFDTVTKRLSVLADKAVLSNNNRGKQYFRTYDEYDQHYLSHEVERSTITVHNVSDLGRWLRQCEPLVLDNRVVYYPNVDVRGFTDELTQPEGAATHFHENLIDFVVRNRKIAEVSDDLGEVKRRYVYRIMDVPLPVIDHADLGTFAKVSIDEADQLDALKDYLREQFLEIEMKEGSEGYFAALEKIGNAANRHMRTIASDMKGLRRKKAIQTSGVIIGTLSAALFAIDATVVEALGAIVGTGGGLSLLLEHLQDNSGVKRKIKSSPFYYLWILRETLSDQI